MKKVLIFILLCLLLACCHNSSRHRSNVAPTALTDTIDVFRHVFKSKALQDSLNAFLNGTEGLLICDTLVYSVYMYKSYPIDIREGHFHTFKEDPDTLLVFNLSYNIWFAYDHDKPEETTFLGAAIKGNKVIGVSCSGIHDYYDIFHENDYRQDIWQRHHMPELMRRDCDINVFWPCSDLYKLVNRDSLVLLRRHRYKRDLSRHASVAPNLLCSPI